MPELMPKPDAPRRSTADEDEIDIGHYVRVLLRGWWLIAIGATVGAVAGLLVATRIPHRYEASTLLRISPPRYGPPVVANAPAVLAVIQNRGVAASVVQELGLDKPPHNLTAQSFADSALTVETLPSTNYLRLRVRLLDRALATEAVKRLTDRLVAESRVLGQEEAVAFNKQLLDQFTAAGTRLRTAEQALFNFRKDAQIEGLEAQLKTVLKQRSTLAGVEAERARLREADEQLARTSRTVTVKGADASGDATAAAGGRPTASSGAVREVLNPAYDKLQEEIRGEPEHARGAATDARAACGHSTVGHVCAAVSEEAGVRSARHGVQPGRQVLHRSGDRVRERASPGGKRRRRATSRAGGVGSRPAVVSKADDARWSGARRGPGASLGRGPAAGRLCGVTSTMSEYWTGKRVCITGGGGFLGSYVAENLRAHGCTDIFIPRRRDYDLTDLTAVRRMYAAAKPDLVIHLASVVGGIGANREHPAKFLYENIIIGTQTMHEAWRAGVGKFVAIGTVCAYPKFTPVPFREEDLWNGYPEETNAPYGLAKKMLLVQSEAYRQEYGFNSIFLLPVNLYGPRDNFDERSSHVIPALIKKCVEARRSGDHSHRRLGRRLADPRVPLRRGRRRRHPLAAERYDRSDPVNLGSAFEISIKDLVETIVRLTGYEGDDRLGYEQAERAAAAEARDRPGAHGVRVRIAHTVRGGPEEDDRLVRIAPPGDLARRWARGGGFAIGGSVARRRCAAYAARSSSRAPASIRP